MNQENTPINPQVAMVASQQFGGSQLQTVQETASNAVAAQAKAQVEARWIVAMKQPRQIEQVRAELIRECKRPSFAEVARYNKPIGQGVTGPSIRFVEAGLQAMGNVLTECTVIYDDQHKRILQISVTDLEKNVTHPKQITVTKQVERNRLRPGQTAIGRRTGSNGQTVFIVEATDDDLLNKEAALVSKALRTCGLRLIPGWLVEECMEQVMATQQDKGAKDPDGERRRMIDAFSQLGITPVDLADYLGHALEKIVPAELVELRATYTTIRDGEATWMDVIETRRTERGEVVDATQEDAKTTQKGTQAAKASLQNAKAKRSNPPKKATPETPTPPPAKQETSGTPSPPPTSAEPKNEPPANPDASNPSDESNGQPAFFGEDDEVPDWMRG